MRRWVVFVTNNSPLFLLLVAAAFLLSLFFVKNLNVEAFPDPAPPIIEMVTLFEGKSAEEVERQITIPAEIALAGMVNLESINSISMYGLSDIKCRFNHDIAYTEAKQQVINRLSTVSLPENVQPSIIPNDIGEVMRYEVKGSNNLMELRGLQDWVIARFLRTAQGVEDVVSVGGYIKAYMVKVIPENLIKYGIPLSQVIEALSKSNLNVGGRAIEMGDQYYIVRGLGLIKNIGDIESTKVATRNGKPILVKNLAEVKIGNIPRTGIVGLNYKDEIVMGTVVLKKGAMSIPSIRSIHEKIAELNDRILPKGIEIKPFYDRWDLITTVIEKVLELASSGIALVALALLIFLGNFRGAIITAIVIPISLLITFAVMAFKGESANLLSIGAIDFGIIADIPLVFIENYFRLAHKSGAGARAIAQAAEEVGKPIFFSVLIILIAFIPIFNMKGAESQIFSPMAKTYLYALVFTLVLTFTYLVASKHIFLRQQQEKELGLIAFAKEKYAGLLGVLLKRPRLVLSMAFAAIAAVMAAGFGNLGTQFLPKMDEGNMYIRILFPHSISLNKAYENTLVARNILREYPEIQTVNFHVGRSEDGKDPHGPFNSEYFAKLKPYDQWTRKMTKEQIEDLVRKDLRALFPNADINISQYIQDNLEETMSGVKGENSVKVFGEDLSVLDEVAEEVKKRIEKAPGIEDVGIFKELGQPNLVIEVDRENAATLGLSVQEVLDTVATALGGKTVTQIVEGTRTSSLFLSFPSEYRKEPEKIATIPIVLADGGLIALSRVANIHFDTGASFIYREDFRRYIPVKFSVTSKDLGGTVEAAQSETAKIKLPEGLYMEWAGMFNEMKQAFKRFYFSIPIALFLILAVLYIFYRSVANVLVTMAAPAFGILGGAVSLVVMDESLSVSSIVGFVSIIGISVLNGSILVNHYIHLTLEGKPRGEAILETARDKFRPVLMGGLVAAVGLLPASIAHGVGSQVQKPLAIVVVGGMLIGTLLILLIIPLLLKYVYVQEQ
ncbi:MAG: efflux RND transporter permease subunit [Nitrospinae bacterium]|nr:efflux RND transporter permease subunit [Nitrospinota bacterium]